MNSGDLIPDNLDRSEPASSEVQFALVIARMIDSVRNSPEHMRQAVYDLARYKQQEQLPIVTQKTSSARRTPSKLPFEVSKSSPGSRSASLPRHCLRKPAIPMLPHRRFANSRLQN
jgi:hypothetical protein